MWFGRHDQKNHERERERKSNLVRFHVNRKNGYEVMMDITVALRNGVMAQPIYLSHLSWTYYNSASYFIYSLQ